MGFKELMPYFQSEDTAGRFAEVAYFGLGVAFILVIIEIAMELFKIIIYRPENHITFLFFKMILIVIFISIYGWYAASHYKRKKEEEK